ncbi:MAG: hypothetical protein VKL20_04720 [Synechocystis sp.]|nr:hypothetical protein [Synechocystis sp.]
MLKKLFGGKDEFFVQLDESQTPAPETTVSESAPEPAAVVSEPPDQTKKTAVKKSAKKSAKAPVTTKAPEPAPVAAPKPKLDPAQVAFASADPIPQNIARRGPGPSLNKFKEMARQVKTR